MQLTFVSSNIGKIEEAQAILGFPIHIAKLELDEVQSLDCDYIITKKAQAAYDILHTPLIVDDVSFEVTAWNGFPGPFIKYLREVGNGNELLLRLLSNETNRHVMVKAIIGYHDGTRVHTFTGEVTGEVVTVPRGERGWGFDPIFIPTGKDKTWAEMTDEEKNTSSHRYHALLKLKTFLENR